MTVGKMLPGLQKGEMSVAHLPAGQFTPFVD
jgi:hypothetical protein